MSYTTNTEVGLYLMSEINFDIQGTPVKLYGGIALTSAKAKFEMGTNVPFDASLFPAAPTQVINEPFGMKGVTLQQLNAKGVFDKTGEVTLSLEAVASLSGLNNFNLIAACVFDKLSPRLIFVELVSTPALTLTQFITDLLGSTWSFASPVTDQFAFQEGQMYYLKEPKGSPADYIYPYTLPTQNKSTSFKPGYHIIGKFQIFGEYNFEVALDVETGGIVLSTTVTTPIDIIEDVVTLSNPELQISTVAPTKYVKISTNILLFNSKVTAQLDAQYNLGQSLFEGGVDVKLDGVSIPNIGGSSSQNLQLSFTFQWSKTNGFKITNIGGLPSNDLALLDQYYKQFQSMGGGGCQAIAKSLISDLDKTKFSVALNGSPTKNGTNLEVPVKLTYEVLFAGSKITSATIDLTPSFVIPTSLDSLPGDIWQWFVDNADTLAEQILSDPQTYKAITIAAANKGLGTLAARLICRALEKFGQAVAEAIADAVAGAAAETLAGALELAGALAAVALAGVSTVVSGLLGLLKSIWDWLTGQDDKKKKEAEAKIRATQAKVNAALDKVFTIISAAQQKIQISALNVEINAEQEFNAQWDVVNYSSTKLGSGANLSYELNLLSGIPGDKTGTQIGSTQVFNNIATTNFKEPLSSIPSHQTYQLNASISTKLTGVAFLDSKTQSSIQNSINQLNNSGNSVAKSFASDLQSKLNTLLGYNTSGIVSTPVYATLNSTGLTLGQSLLGLNSKIQQ